jgi:hypothetical protein
LITIIAEVVNRFLFFNQSSFVENSDEVILFTVKGSVYLSYQIIIIIVIIILIIIILIIFMLLLFIIIVYLFFIIYNK